MYITEEQLKGFDTYKYKCVDTSPLANYVMHPFWNQFVKLFPKWVAPNLMTFVGFLLLVVQMGVLICYDPYYKASSLNDAFPSWVWYFSCFAQFFSHTLDGIDGKQARRTRSSSPLGELFDHGLDSWSTAFFMFNIYSLFGRQLVSVSEMMLVFWIVTTSFFFSHWEKYNTGVLFLPWAYDVSQVALTIVYGITAVYGISFWHGSLLGISLVNWLRIMLYAGSAGLAIPTSFYNVYVARRKGQAVDRSLYETALPLFSPVLCGLVFTIWITFSPARILEANPRLVMFSASVILSNIACRLIVAQMSNWRCQVLNPSISLNALCLIAVLLTHDPKIELSIFWTYTIVITLAHIHYGIVVVRTLADYLHINVFSIKKQSD